MSAPSAYWQKHNCQPQQKTDRGGSARSHLTRSGRRNSVFFYGVSPSNPLAFEAAARVRQSHVSSLAKSLAKFHRAKQAQSAINRPSGQCHAVEALQLAHGKNVLGLD